MHTKCQLENPKGKVYSEDLGVDGKKISERILRKSSEVFTGFTLLRVETCGGVL